MSKVENLEIDTSQSWNILKLKYLKVERKPEGFLMSGELADWFPLFSQHFHPTLDPAKVNSSIKQ